MNLENTTVTPSIAGPLALVLDRIFLLQSGQQTSSFFLVCINIMTRLVLSLIISYFEKGAGCCGGRKLVLMFYNQVVVVVKKILYLSYMH